MVSSYRQIHLFWVLSTKNKQLKEMKYLQWYWSDVCRNISKGWKGCQIIVIHGAEIKLKKILIEYLTNIQISKYLDNVSIFQNMRLQQMLKTFFQILCICSDKAHTVTAGWGSARQINFNFCMFFICQWWHALIWSAVDILSNLQHRLLVTILRTIALMNHKS